MGSAIAIRHQNYLASVLWSFLGTGGLSDCWDSVLWQNKREDDRGEMSPQTGFAAREPRETQLGVVGMFGAPWCSLSSILPWEVCDCSRVGPSTNGMCSWRTNSGWQKSEHKHSGVPGYTLGLLHWAALDRGQMAPGLGQAQTHCFVQHRHWARLIEQTAAQKEMNWNNSYTECVFKMVDTIEAILPRDTGWYSPLTKLNILRKYRR